MPRPRSVSAGGAGSRYHPQARAPNGRRRDGASELGKGSIFAVRLPGGMTAWPHCGSLARPDAQRDGGGAVRVLATQRLSLKYVRALRPRGREGSQISPPRRTCPHARSMPAPKRA